MKVPTSITLSSAWELNLHSHPPRSATLPFPFVGDDGVDVLAESGGDVLAGEEVEVRQNV